MSFMYWEVFSLFRIIFTKVGLSLGVGFISFSELKFFDGVISGVDFYYFLGSYPRVKSGNVPTYPWPEKLSGLSPA